MARFPNGVSCRVLPSSVLSELERLLAQYGQSDRVTLLTDRDVPQVASQDERFWLLLSSELSVLVLSEPHVEPSEHMRKRQSSCRIGLTFEVNAIAELLSTLLELSLSQAQQQWLAGLKEQLHPSSPQAQGDFTLALMERFSEALLQADQASMCHPVQQALDQQLERSLVLNQVITRIQESLELSVILQTTVAEVRRFLQADRLLIYQFDLAKSQNARSMADFQIDAQPDAVIAIGKAHHSGYITYESRANEQLPSVLHYTETYCFNDQPDCRLRYLEGKAYAVEDVQSTYQHSTCLLTFLEQVQVRSKLVAPIVVNQKLWGLLIAHQCTHQRQWQPWELEFLQHIAEHLAIAINQAQLYKRLQQQTQNLESCVIERTQDLRDALAAAQSANRAKSEFLATMSHELRTPLTCVIGLSATLLRWSFGELSDRQREYLNTIHASGEHLLALINDILEVSKIESGRTVLDVNEFSITSLGRQSLDAYRSEAADHDIELNLDLKLTPEQDSFVADSRRVRQILSNLLSNAIKFTPPSGKVTLRLRREQQLLTVQVEDTGIGIPESLQPLLFEKFQQLEKTRERQYQGTGLGLALTKQLVDLHGGSISVTSRVGMGSIFTVRLPTQRSTLVSKTSAAQPVAVEPTFGRVILLEENEESAAMICDMLTAANYQVIWIVEGSQVLEQVELLHPAAVITAVNLSGFNGYDVIRSLRRYVGTLEIKVLALTDHHDEEQAGKALRSGADGVLTKPIDPEKLLATMTAVMALAHHQP
ncbi:MAG TPA: ATP-binding protein [Leptolyngbyaceae cyanobacterium]